MSVCKYFQECEFVLQYVARVKPHWDDFISLYCHGDFQDVCKRLEWFETYGDKPAPDLMPTGRRVPVMIDKQG
jgi:hypothetical protein